MSTRGELRCRMSCTSEHTVVGRALSSSEDCSYHSALVSRKGIVELKLGIFGTGISHLNVVVGSGATFGGGPEKRRADHALRPFQCSVVRQSSNVRANESLSSLLRTHSLFRLIV